MRSARSGTTLLLLGSVLCRTRSSVSRAMAVSPRANCSDASGNARLIVVADPLEKALGLLQAALLDP